MDCFEYCVEPKPAGRNVNKLWLSINRSSSKVAIVIFWTWISLYSCTLRSIFVPFHGPQRDLDWQFWFSKIHQPGQRPSINRIPKVKSVRFLQKPWRYLWQRKAKSSFVSWLYLETCSYLQCFQWNKIVMDWEGLQIEYQKNGAIFQNFKPDSWDLPLNFMTVGLKNRRNVPSPMQTTCVRWEANCG